MDELRELCAAYEAAMNCDYCPGPAEAAELAGEIETDFTADEFRRGAKKNQGRRPDEIARSIIRAAGRLKKQHAALEQLARRTNYTVTYDNSSRRFEVVYNRAMNYYTADADLEVAALKALDRLNSKK